MFRILHIETGNFVCWFVNYVKNDDTNILCNPYSRLGSEIAEFKTFYQAEGVLGSLIGRFKYTKHPLYREEFDIMEV